MKLLLITAKGRFVPQQGDHSGFVCLPASADGKLIFKKQCDDCLVYVTKCIDDESLSPLVKQNLIADVLTIVEQDAAGTDITDKYIIAHDGDFLGVVPNGQGRNGIFYENELAPDNMPAAVNRLRKRIPDKHIYLFQHEPAPKDRYLMFHRVITKIKNDFSKEHVQAALDLF